MSDYGDEYDEPDFEIQSIGSEEIEDDIIDEEEEDEDQDDADDEEEKEEDEDVKEVPAYEPIDNTIADEIWSEVTVTDEDNVTADCLDHYEYFGLLGQLAQLISQGYEVPEDIRKKLGKDGHPLDEIGQARELLKRNLCPLTTCRCIHKDEKKKIRYVRKVDPNKVAHPVIDD